MDLPVTVQVRWSSACGLHVHEIYLKGKHGYPGVSPRAAMKEILFKIMEKRHFSCTWPTAATMMAELPGPTPCPRGPIAWCNPSPIAAIVAHSHCPIWSTAWTVARAKTLCPFFLSDHNLFQNGDESFGPVQLYRGIPLQKIVPCPFFISYVK